MLRGCIAGMYIYHRNKLWVILILSNKIRKSHVLINIIQPKIFDSTRGGILLYEKTKLFLEFELLEQ